MTKIKIHPLAVKFEEVECCALKTAIANPFHRLFIKESVEQAKESEPKHEWSLLTEIFKNTSRLIFIPGAVHKNFYFNLAIREKQLMRALSCNHTLAEHIKALNNICFMMTCSRAEMN